jgi:pimeloyl-ACP methyl ester carboxylesterase
MRKLKWIALTISGIFLIGLVGFTFWATNTPTPMAEAQMALASDEEVEVQSKPWLVFQPTGDAPTAGLVFYPGGRVDPRAYAPAARRIAQSGYLVVVAPMPLNLAVFGVDRAREVISAFPGIRHWAIAGHSLGGAMAANFADQNPDLVDGIALWAAYPANKVDLSDQDIEAVSIYATRDGLASLSDIQSSLSRLPPETRWVAIEGGNHAQFGWYGPQAGDQEAGISREDQQNQIVQATLKLLDSIDSQR